MNTRWSFSLYHLLRSIISFCAFIVFSYIISFILYKTAPISADWRELVSFISASAIASSLFFFFHKIITPPQNADGTYIKNPSVTVNGFYTTTGKFPFYPGPVHVIFAFSLLVAVMYLVSITFDTIMSGSESDTVSSFTYGLISCVLIHPVLEEYMFRGLYYRELRPMSSIFACLMQSVMFAISHSGDDDMIFALACGIILALVAEKTNGIIAPIIAHMLINLRTLLYLTYIPESVHSYIDIGIIALGFLSLICLSATHNHRHILIGDIISEEDALND